jgi:hypothetical protein
MLYRQQYAAPIGFDDFWTRFSRVLQLGNPMREQAKRVLAQVLQSLLYVLPGRGKAERENCAHRGAIAVPIDFIFDDAASLADAVGLAKQYVQACAGAIAYDFTADAILLDFFADLDKGFHQAAFVGNILRKYLHDLVERGFVSLAMIGGADAPSLTERSHASAPLLAAWLLTRDIARLDADEESTLEQAVIDIDPDLDGTSALDTLAASPLDMAEFILRHHIGRTKEQDPRRPQIIAREYLDFRAAKRASSDNPQSILRAKRETEARALRELRLPILATQINTAPLFGCTLVETLELHPYTIRVARPVFAATLAYDRVVARIQFPATGKSVIVRAIDAHDSADVHRIEANLGEGQVTLRFYNEMRVVDHIVLRVYATEAETPDNLDTVLEQALFNRPGLTLGQEIVLRNGKLGLGVCPTHSPFKRANARSQAPRSASTHCIPALETTQPPCQQRRCPWTSMCPTR